MSADIPQNQLRSRAVDVIAIWWQKLNSIMAECIKHVATIGNSIIGVSVLAIPFCFKQCGIVLGTLMLLLSALLTRFNCHLLLKGALQCRRKSFELFAFHSFGYYGKLAVETSIIGFLMGMLISFYVVIGDLGPPVISGKLDIENLPPLRSIVLIAIGLGVVLPLGLLKNIDSLGGISAISILFYIFLVLKVFIDALPILVSGDWTDKVNYWRPQGVFQSLPIFAMALSCQTQIFEIYNVLPDPSLGKMNKLIKMAIYLSTTIYVSVGFFGYVAFCNEEIYGNVLVMMPSSYTTQLIKLGFIWSVVVSFPLVIFPCRASICSLFNNKKLHTLDIGAAYIPEERFRTVTVFLVLSTLGLGILCPNIEMVLGLVGSTIGTVICIIFPALLFVRITNRETFERTGAQVVLCIGVFLLVTCTYMTINNNTDNVPAGNLAAIEKKIAEVEVHYKPVFTLEALNVKQTPIVPVKLVRPNANVKTKVVVEPEPIKHEANDEKKEGHQEPPVPQEPDNIKNSVNINDTPDKKPVAQITTEIAEKLKAKDINVKTEDVTHGLASNQEAILKQLAQQQKEILQQQKQVLAELKAHKELHLPVENIAEAEREPVPQQKEIVPQPAAALPEGRNLEETVEKIHVPAKTVAVEVEKSLKQQKESIQQQEKVVPVLPKEPPQQKIILPQTQKEIVKQKKPVNEQPEVVREKVQPVEHAVKDEAKPPQLNQQEKVSTALPVVKIDANAKRLNSNNSSIHKKHIPETNKTIHVATTKLNKDVDPINAKKFVSPVVQKANISSSQTNNKPKRSAVGLNLVPDGNLLAGGPVFPVESKIGKEQEHPENELSVDSAPKKNAPVVTEKAHVEIR